MVASSSDAAPAKSCLRLTFAGDEGTELMVDATSKAGGRGRKSVAFQEAREEQDEAVVKDICGSINF